MMLDKFFLNWYRVPYKNIDLVIIGLCNILDGITLVLSLGFIKLSLHFKYVKWRTYKMIYVKEKNEK